MPHAEDLLDQAKRLLTLDKKKPKQANLRRAVSTAYYAMFHAMIDAAIAEVMSQEDASSALGMRVRRVVTHASVLLAAKWFGARGTPPQVLLELRAGATWPPSGNITSLCDIVIDLQAARSQADYDFSINFDKKQAEALVADAKLAVQLMAKLKGDADCRIMLWTAILGDAIKRNG